MTVDPDPSALAGRQPTPTGVSVAVGWVVMVAAALLAAALFPPSELPGRVLVMAVAAGVFAAVVAYRHMRSMPQPTGAEPDPRWGLRSFTVGPEPVALPPDRPFGGSRGA